MTDPRLAAYVASRRWAAEHGHPQPDDRMLDAAFAALPGWGTYRTAWESGYGAGRDDEAAGVPTERTAPAVTPHPFQANPPGFAGSCGVPGCGRIGIAPIHTTSRAALSTPPDTEETTT